MARESLGSQMMFELHEYLREQIADINDTVLGKFNAIKKIKEEQE
jgi:hypothetical protein